MKDLEKTGHRQFAVVNSLAGFAAKLLDDAVIGWRWSP
jgi:hypothetical protein